MFCTWNACTEDELPSVCLDTLTQKQPRPSKSGQKWMEKDGEEIKYAWVKGDLIVPAQLIDSLFDQNNDGKADQDLDDDDEGVELTNMVDEVFEGESDENW